MNKKQFLLQLQAVNLIAVDLHLFLDTHPDNKEALNDYEKVSKQYQSLKQQYEQQFGPLVSFGYSSSVEHYNGLMNLGLGKINKEEFRLCGFMKKDCNSQ